MRKTCNQKYDDKSFVQLLKKGGWKRAKKMLATVLAAAMVVTSGAVIPQNTKVAEAADVIATVGTDNGDGSYTLTYADNHYSVGEESGDFCSVISFHQSSQVAFNWHAYVVKVAVASDESNAWVVRPDYYTIANFANCTAVLDGGPVWETYASIMQNADVSITVTRIDSTITINHSAVNTSTGESFSFNYHVDNAPTDDMKIYLGGESCQLAINEVKSTPKHTVTVNYVDGDGNEAADIVTKQVLEGFTYSIASPSIEGLKADKTVVSGTMGSADVTETVTYTSAEKHTVTVDYVDETGTKVADSVTEEIDEGKAYSIKSPAVEGKQPDKTTVSGTMSAEDANVTVTYKSVKTTVGDDTHVLGWADYSNFCKVLKKEGDFNVGFSFHNDSDGANAWGNYAVAVTTDLAATAATWLGNAKEWYVRGDMFSSATFAGSSITDEGTLPEDAVETLKDSEVSVSVSRKDTTITISSTVTGANGKSFSWTKTATDCPTDTAAIYLGGDSCKLSIYDATESDSFEKHSVTVHYVYQNGSKAADDVIKEADGGTSYSIQSPVLSGYRADRAIVSGAIGSEDEEITVTYKQYIATVGYGNGDGTYSGDWNSLSAGYKILKSGDFNVSFSFHNESAGVNNWDNYGISLTTNTSSTFATYEAHDKDWFLRADRFNLDTFAGSEVLYADEQLNWDTFAATMKDAEVTVGIQRTGNTIVITHSVTGANGLSFSWSATATNCPTSDLAITLTSSNSKLYIYEAPMPDLPMVEPTVTDAIAVIGSGSYDLAWNDYDKFYNSSSPAGDFTVTYDFHNYSAGELNWSNYAVVLKDASGAVWHQRADCWALGQDTNTAIFGTGSPDYAGVPSDWDAFLDTIKDSDVTVTVVREGTTITIYNSIKGVNGNTISWSATATDCTTEAISVLLGGEGCMLKVSSADIKEKAEAPSVEPVETPDVPSQPTEVPTQTPGTEPTEEPTQTPSAEPTKQPVVSNGDKVAVSKVTYEVTSTKNKTVSYVAAKNVSTKATVTVPATIKVTTGGKKVTYKVTTISKNAFANAKKLQKVTIGKNVKKIEAGAFKNCSKLSTIVIQSKNLTSVGKNALKGTTKKLVIKVPAGKLAAYKKLFKGKGNSSVTIKKA